MNLQPSHHHIPLYHEYFQHRSTHYIRNRLAKPNEPPDLQLRLHCRTSMNAYTFLNCKLFHSLLILAASGLSYFLLLLFWLLLQFLYLVGNRQPLVIPENVQPEEWHIPTLPTNYHTTEELDWGAPPDDAWTENKTTFWDIPTLLDIDDLDWEPCHKTFEPTLSDEMTIRSYYQEARQADHDALISAHDNCIAQWQAIARYVDNTYVSFKCQHMPDWTTICIESPLSGF